MRGEVTNRVLLGCNRHGRPGTPIGAHRSATSSRECSGSPRFLRSVTRPNIAQPSPVKHGAMLP